jgi:hypothetical protein
LELAISQRLTIKGVPNPEPQVLATTAGHNTTTETTKKWVKVDQTGIYGGLKVTEAFSKSTLTKCC